MPALERNLKKWISRSFSAQSFGSPTAALPRRRWLRLVLPLVKTAEGSMGLSASILDTLKLDPPECFPIVGLRCGLPRSHRPSPITTSGFECPECDRSLTEIVRYR